MGYIYVEVISEQISKKPEKPSGDVLESIRDKTSTVHILCDGMGSGTQANITATMCVARVKELVRGGTTVRQAFANIVHSMENARKKDYQCAFLSVVRVLNDGVTTILTYEMPGALFVSPKYSTPLKSINQTFADGVVGEASCSLNVGEGILLFSDGIAQAGLGKGYPYGWGIEGINKFVNDTLRGGYSIKDLPKMVLKEAKKIWQQKCEDDCSVSLIYCRKGREINIFTGPPTDPDMDEMVVNKFLSNEGLKIVCGASTAKIVARVLGKELEINPNFKSMIAPPDYEIEGIDIVTEGAVTLNQLYNVWDAEFNKMEKDSPVTDMYAMINVADRVNIYIGKSKNPAEDDISFTQTGILSRDKILPLLVEKFRSEGKLVWVEEF
jgi:hypothetical protein